MIGRVSRGKTICQKIQGIVQIDGDPDSAKMFGIALSDISHTL